MIYYIYKVEGNRNPSKQKEVRAMKKPKEKAPRTYEVSYIKVTYDKDGKVASVTVKYVNRATRKR